MNEPAHLESLGIDALLAIIAQQREQIAALFVRLHRSHSTAWACPQCVARLSWSAWRNPKLRECDDCGYRWHVEQFAADGEPLPAGKTNA